MINLTISAITIKYKYRSHEIALFEIAYVCVIHNFESIEWKQTLS